MDGPAPGSYEPTKAHDYVTMKKDFVTETKSTSNRTNFTEAYAKLYKYIPGMGHYKEIDKGLALRSKSR